VKFLTYYINRFRDLFVLLIYITLSFLLMVSSDSKIVEGLRSTTLSTFGFLNSSATSLSNYFHLRQENQQLRLQNIQLAYENYQLQDALLENLRLKKMLQFKNILDYKLVPAKIIGFAPQDFVTGFLIAIRDSGTIRKDAAVLTDDGLVGKIVKVSHDYAICQNLFDPNSRVSVRIQRNRELGIVVWDGGNGLLLENIPNTIEVRVGDVLFTSGMSRIFPPNVKVGYVISIKKNIQNLFQTIHVKPAVQINRLEEVAIMLEKPNNGS